MHNISFLSLGRGVAKGGYWCHGPPEVQKIFFLFGNYYYFLFSWALSEKYGPNPVFSGFGEVTFGPVQIWAP